MRVPTRELCCSEIHISHHKASKYGFATKAISSQQDGGTSDSGFSDNDTRVNDKRNSINLNSFKCATISYVRKPNLMNIKQTYNIAFKVKWIFFSLTTLTGSFKLSFSLYPI